MLLTSPAELELGLQLRPPTVELLDSLANVPWSRASAADAERDGLAYLVRTLRADGSWPDTSELANPRYRNSVALAIHALAARALLAGGERAAAERALETLARTRASTSTWKGPEAMNYAAWELAVSLELLADFLAAGIGDAGTLREQGAELAEELVERQRSNGGWSYFYSTSMNEGATQLEQSISFVTATVVLGLMRARAAGIEIDEDALERGLDALEAMRGDDGVFAYMLWNFQAHGAPEPAPGAAGRLPACELALYRAERSDRERLHGALDLFFEHVSDLARERGKALMHCGAQGQGCHYVLYDYAMAAQAIAELPAEERAPYRERLLARLLDCRRSDGSFVDAPVVGPVAGTALALAALRSLAR